MGIQTRKEVMFNNVTAITGLITGTATSRSAGVDNADRLSLMIFGNNISTGSATFYVDVSNDGSLGWVPYQRLVTNVTNTNAQNDARTNSLAFTANGTAMLFIPSGDTFSYLRVRADINKVEGTYGVILFVN